MEKKNEKEVAKVLSIAGEVLEKEYIANEKAKSVAGSVLVCLGHKGDPSKKTRETAKQMITANEKDKKLYREKEIILARYVLSHKVKMRIISTKK